jgi:hypothetical protein
MSLPAAPPRPWGLDSGEVDLTERGTAILTGATGHEGYPPDANGKVTDICKALELS